MYHSHVPLIAAGMRQSGRVFKRGVLFAILSVRSQFVRIDEQMNDLTKFGADSRDLWGWKRDSYSFVVDHGDELWRTLIRHVPIDRPDLAIVALSRVPGLGIVKAAFVAQYMGWDVGCLDTRNINRLGLSPRAYRTDGASCKAMPAFRRKVDRYVTETGGKAQELWDAWCRDVAVVYRKTPEEISAMHLLIVPPAMRARLTPFPLSHVNLAPDNSDAPF